MRTMPRAKTHAPRAIPWAGAICLALSLPLSGCMPDATLETDAQKVSYGKGLEVARSMGDMADSLDLGALLLGLTAGLDGMDPQISAEEIEAAHARMFGEAGAAEERAPEEADADESEGEGGEGAGDAAGASPDTTGSSTEG